MSAPSSAPSASSALPTPASLTPPPASNPPLDSPIQNSKIENQKSSLSSLRTAILSSLAQALLTASQRLCQSASGQSVFSNDADLKSTLALLHLAPHLLPLLKQDEDDEDGQDDDDQVRFNRFGLRTELAHPSLGPLGPKILEELEEMRRRRIPEDSPESSY